MSNFVTLTGRCHNLKALRADDIRTIEQEDPIDGVHSTVVTLFNGTQFLVKEPIAVILKQIDKQEK